MSALVKSRHCSAFLRCPPCPRKRTFCVRPEPAVDTGKLLDESESRPPSGGGLTHFEVKTVSASRPPSEPLSIVLLKRTSAAVAMASFI